MEGDVSGERIWAGIEGGGTKFVCAVGSGPDAIEATQTIPTTAPAETLRAAGDFIERAAAGRALAAIGIAHFGPLDLDHASATYGSVTTTPKPGWAGANVVGYFRERFGVPISWDTDVNGTALGELRWGAGRGLRSLVYFTIGTGIGGGAIVDGRPVHGLLHPEMGHIPIVAFGAREPAGVCPYHGGRCVEGVASGPAIAARAGRPGHELPPDHPIWEEEAHYLAFLAASTACMYSPQRIIFGGGVMRQEHLLERIRERFLAILNGYLRSPVITRDVASYLVAPGLGDRAGVLGALALAQDAANAVAP
jgi:fructokinase